MDIEREKVDIGQQKVDIEGMPIRIYNGEEKKQMKKGRFILMLCCLALICFGCKSSVPDKNEKTDGKDSVSENENGVDVSENLMTVYSSITADMLDACNTVVSDLDSYYDSYYHDSLVLLNWFNDDTRLYGINAGEESAMLLYVQGEKVLIPYSFWNVYLEPPKMNVCDLDADGENEIIISQRILTGTELHQDGLLVCDCADTWSVFSYDTNLQDIENSIEYKYDENADAVVFFNKEDGTVLTEIALPDWTEEYPYSGEVDFSNNIRFDVEEMQMKVVPGILMENSMPYYPSVFLNFDLNYRDGTFEIEKCEIERNAE